MQPVGALDDVEAAERDQQRRNDRRGEHPAPGPEVGQSREDEIADRGAAEGSDCLEGESPEHEFAARAARDVLGNNDVSRRVVAAERVPNRRITTREKFGANTSATRNATKITISTKNMILRPNRSDRPPRPTAPTRMPNRVAAVINPFSAGPIPNSRERSGSATPVMNATNPSKNLPAAASDQMSHCMPVIGADGSLVPSDHIGKFVNVLLNRLRAGLASQFRLCDGVHPELRPVVVEPHQTTVVRRRFYNVGVAIRP